MSSTTKVLTEFVRVLHDGMELYSAAIETLDEPALNETFRDFIAEREETIRHLKPYIVEPASWPEGDGTVGGTARKYVAKARTLVQSTKSAYLAELVRLEGRTLDKLDKSIRDAPTVEVKSVLNDLRPRFQSGVRRVKGMQVASIE